MNRIELLVMAILIAMIAVAALTVETPAEGLQQPSGPKLLGTAGDFEPDEVEEPEDFGSIWFLISGLGLSTLVWVAGFVGSWERFRPILLFVVGTGMVIGLMLLTINSFT